jgi:polyisoprenoid-binding protein YceI
LDKNHASLLVRVNHLGLSNYTLRFTDFDAKLTFDPAMPANSKVSATINPISIKSDYPGDYKATHKGSIYKSWADDLAKNPNWLNADTHKTIGFASTALDLTGARTAKMTGHLTFLGVTKPVTLDVTFNGDAKIPFMNDLPAVGFSAKGALNRSDFGMKHYVGPISDAVEIVIEAEFHKVMDAPAAPAKQ